jgi:hypothetical protein
MGALCGELRELLDESAELQTEMLQQLKVIGYEL